MPAIGITGGISTGKSTFCEYLREILPDAKFFEADDAAHQLVDFDSEVKTELLAEFGAEVFSREGDLNRAALRAIILANAEKKAALEKILHPRIRRQWSAEAQKHRQPFDFFFADIPLLYETGGESLCDRVVVVACSPEIQLARLQKRGRTGHRPVATANTKVEDVATLLRDVREAEKLIKSQMPLEEKIRRADHVVWNNGGRAVLMEQARLLVQFWRKNKWTNEYSATR